MLKTGLLMTILMGFCLMVGEILGGRQGLLFAFLVGGVSNLFMYWFSDKLVLGMHRATPVSQQELPEVYAIVRELTTQANIPLPKIYLIDTPLPNAFATGRNPSHAAVAVTRGILDILDERELRGVLAHELSHVLHRDILISTIASVLAGAIMLLARMAMWGTLFADRRRSDNEGMHPLAGLLMLVLAPLAAMLIQMAISRSREFHADEAGARLSQDPLALARALQKIERVASTGGLPSGNPTMAHLYIINPFNLEGVTRLFLTHPTTSERISRLEEIAGHLKLSRRYY